MIRRINPWELTDLVPLAEQFHAEAGLGGEFSHERFYDLLSDNCRTGSLCAIGYWVDDKLAGALVGVLFQAMMTTTKVAQEIFWYIQPEHRGIGMSSIQMVERFEQWGKEAHADCVIMASLTKNPSVSRLYQARGYTEIESHHLKFL